MSHSLEPIGIRSTVTMYFSIALEDGTVVESNFGDQPLRFTMDDGTLIKGLELALYGLRAGDRQSLRLPPREAFGYADESNVHVMPRAQFKSDVVPEPGMVIGFTTPQGDEVPGLVRAVTDTEVTVDFNHPLAGHEITFDVEILAVEPAEPL